ncbi:hypothetical protein ACIQXV_10230 [Neobacillus sp. NPDC097160]|uniref:hypothetical protein n=1 Tax=Neobacillus sp. NPDC097160 TaxID=3364298 RepID=UPI00382BF430
MDKNQQEQKRFFEQQLQWTLERARILDEINVKLHEMKEIVKYVLIHELSSSEIEELNSQMDNLKNVIQCLEKQLYTVIH